MSPQSAFNLESIYNMFLYAWKLWPSSADGYSSSRELNDPLDLVGRLLSQSVIKASKAGFHRDYISINELTQVPRGRILFNESLKLRAMNDTRVYVETDEFTVDCIHNQILAWAVVAMLKVPKLDHSVRADLLIARDLLHVVTESQPTLRQMNAALSVARRREYKFGISMAILLLQSEIFSSGGSDKYSVSIPEADDEHLFRRLYEEFLREFFRYHCPDKKVTSRIYKWSDNSLNRFPRMITDINIEDEGHIAVLDAKCTPRVLLHRDEFSSSTLNSGHLYQIFSYMAHAATQNPQKKISGLLVYPQYEYAVDENIMTIHGNLRVKTIDFKTEWQAIFFELKELASQSLT